MQDEKWKEENCRVCPKCNRAVEKLSGIMNTFFSIFLFLSLDFYPNLFM